MHTGRSQAELTLAHTFPQFTIYLWVFTHIYSKLERVSKTQQNKSFSIVEYLKPLLRSEAVMKMD